MGKRRNTAKTGDKAVYNSRSSQKSQDDEKDNNYMRLESDEEDDTFSQGSNHQEIDVKQDVMDLGIGGGSDSSDDNSSDSGDGKKMRDDDYPEDDDSSSSESSDDDDQGQPSDPRHWGNKKSSYYNGDTGDIEIGQDKEDAFDEEEAAKEVESSRYKYMDEGDFMLPDDDDEDGVGPTESRSTSRLSGQQIDGVVAVRDVSKLSTRDKRKFLKKQHPELIPLTSFFSDICKELRDTTVVATDILTKNEDTVESVGATTQGQQYLLTKSMLGNSTALNAAVYLLLKSEMGQKEKDIDSSSSSNSSILAHPVMTQLQKCNTSKEKFKEEVTSRIGDIDEQVKYLVKAAALITKSDHNVTSDEERTIDAEIPHSDEVEDKSSVFLASEVPSEDDVENESNDSPEVDNMKARKAKEAAVLNEARFGLRPSEVVPKSVRSLRRKAESDTYFGDLNQNDASSKTKFLASAINSIEQRSVSKKKRKNDDLVEQIDEIEVDSDLAQGLKMMEEELRKLENADGEGGDITNDGNGESTVMHESGEGGMDFYSLVANRMKEKKMIKKKRYEVAPKYPGTETEITGERAISRAIMKNRGLVAHKAKINRNPRVKKREQYRKALIRRKGAVREVRTDEGHKYSGEGTGIKSGISRSRKL